MAQSLFVPTVRPRTTDAEIWQNVFVDNAYGLREFATDDVIIDVGAHIGAFTCACLARGGQRIFAFEPDRESYSLAQLNVWRFASEMRLCELPHLYGCAVWRSDRDERLSISDVPTSRFSHVPHPAGVSTLLIARDSPEVPVIGLDRILDEFDHVTLLKLDCEGAEWAILRTAQGLSKVAELIVEVHSLSWKRFELNRIQPVESSMEFESLGTDDLISHLGAFGLKCVWRSIQNALLGDARFWYGQMRFQSERPPIIDEH